MYNIIWLNNLIIDLKLYAKFSIDSEVYKTQEKILCIAKN